MEKSFSYLGILFVAALLLLGSGCAERVEPDAIAAGDTGQGLQLQDDPPVIPEQLDIPILVYHHIRPLSSGFSADAQAYEIAPATLKAQLVYLKDQGFESVSLSDIAAAFSEGEPLPEKPIVITFDDGRDTQYTEAFPLLKEYGFTASFFIFTNAPNRPGYVTWDQLAEMRDAGMEIGSHGVYHPFLTKSSDEELVSELHGSRVKIQEKLGVAGNVIAYPFGLYDDRVIEAARDAGYVAARGLEHTVTHTADDVMSLGSYITTSNMAWFRNIINQVIEN
jgi:peptidoglycan/xylan/chitin deacetylase (PgdA/CDA1 family)